MKDKILISVIGGHKCDKRTASLAKEVGRIVAELGAILVCGGLGGVMENACLGAKNAGGMTIGILPGKNKDEANPFIDVPVPTGLGCTRNTIVAGCADIVIALKGKEGTLSEIGFALSEKKPVIGLGSWKIPGMIQVDNIKLLKRRIKSILRKI